MLEKNTLHCTKCNKTIDQVNIIRIEKNYYQYFLDTKQLEDYHGDGEVISQEINCIYCGEILEDNE